MTMATPGVPRSSMAIPFVGRLEERAWLSALLAEAGRGEARLAVIRGEPGAGKTRLAREMLAAADAAGWQTLIARCLEGAPSPLAPFLPEVLPRLRQAGLLAASRAGAEPAADGSSFARLLASLAARRQLVLLVDDIQWLESGGMSFFRDLVMALSDIASRERLPLLVVATLRAPHESGAELGEIARLYREPITRVLDLSGLGEVEANEFVREALGANCEPLLLQLLAETTRGNPLFLGEALRDLSAQGVLAASEGSVHATVSIQRLVVAASAPEALRSRLGRIEASLVPLLELAAVLGDAFERETVSLLSPAPTRALDELVRQGLLVGDGDSFRFSHALVRQAALERIPPGRRRELHAAVAAALVSAAGDSGPHLLDVAEHLAASHPVTSPESASLFERAGDLAMGSFAWSHAARYYARAAECTEYVEQLQPAACGSLLARLGRALANIGDLATARARYEEAIPLLRDSGRFAEWGDLVLRWERTFSVSGQQLPSSEHFEEFKRRAGGQYPALEAALLAKYAESLWLARDDRALSFASEAVELARGTDPTTVASAQTTMGLVRMQRLEAGASLEAFRAAAEAMAPDPNPVRRAWGTARQPIPLLMLGRIAQAETAASTALESARAAADWSHASLSAALLAASYLARGRADDARIASQQALMFLHRSGFALTAFTAGGVMTAARLLDAEYEEAHSSAAWWGQNGGRSVARPYELLASCYLGEESRVRDELRSRPPSLARCDYTSIGALAGWIDVAARLGDEALAERAAIQLEHALETGTVWAVAPPVLLLRPLATADRLCGRFLRSRERLNQAYELARDSGARPEAVLTRLELAETEAADPSGDRERAVDLLRGVAGEAVRLDLAGIAGRIFQLAGRLDVRLAPGDFQVPVLELSSTERQLLADYATGVHPSVTGANLLLAPRTVEAMLSRLARRLGVTTAAHAAELLQSLGAAPPPVSPAPAAPASSPFVALSAREQEVLGLIALGRTNSQIADELVISLHTVARHVANIFSKTGAANRTEAARYARGDNEKKTR